MNEYLLQFIYLMCLFFHQLVVALLEWFYDVSMKLCTTSFDCGTESVAA